MSAFRRVVGRDIAIGDTLAIADGVEATVTGIDRNDGHILLFEVEGWDVTVGVGVEQEVAVLVPVVAYTLSLEVMTLPAPPPRP